MGQDYRLLQSILLYILILNPSLKMKQILVPYDFSSVAEHALDFACQIAHKIDGEIMLLHVIEHPTEDAFKTLGVQYEDPMEQLYIKKMYESVGYKLNEVVSKYKYVDERISTKIQLGNPFNSIIDQIAEENVSLLVVGTEGADGLEELLVGSQAEKIVRKATAPVITVRDKCEIEPIEKMVFASDFTHFDDELVSSVKELQETLEARLYLVKINTPSSFTTTRHDMEQMKKFAAKYELDNYELAIYNQRDEAVGIIHFAEDMGADMVALGTHQRKGLGHFLSGSIAEDVVNHSKIPIWTSHLHHD